MTFDQAVYFIGRVIDENGLPAHHFGRRAFEEEVPKLERRLLERIDAALAEQAAD